MGTVENVNIERITRLETQMADLKEDVAAVKSDIKELHSRITTGNREIMDRLDQKIDELAKSDKDQHASLKQTMENVKERVDILERWRWMIVGAAIVCGYLLGNTNLLNVLFK
jgi:predicted RNase H-like nuclease (RuvC/YqgF family)